MQGNAFGPIDPRITCPKAGQADHTNRQRDGPHPETDVVGTGNSYLPENLWDGL
jgi:hypothetical protein